MKKYVLAAGAGLALFAAGCGGGSDSKDASPTVVGTVATASSSAPASPRAAQNATTTPTAAVSETTAATATAATAAPTTASSGGGTTPVAQQATATPVPPTPVPPTPTPQGASLSATVSLNAQTFSPTNVTVGVGGTVTFVWAAQQFHNVAVAGFPASDTVNSGSVSRTFSAAGTYAFHCDVHPDTMQGSVTVR